MSLAAKTEYMHEPTDLQCGQAVLAMLTGESAETIAAELGNDRETTLAEMFKVLDTHGIIYDKKRKAAARKNELPPICILSLETPRCWHWSLYRGGVFYDPEHGVSDDFPVCSRKFYWEILG